MRVDEIADVHDLTRVASQLVVDARHSLRLFCMPAALAPALHKSDLLLRRPACGGLTMSAKFVSIISTLIVLLATQAARAEPGVEPYGVWLTQAGDAKVKVTKCGGGICGVIVWLKEPIDPATGKPAIDNNNPNPVLAARQMIGLPLFTGMQPAGANKWSGQIYNPDDGKMYASNIALTGASTLRVEGCVGALCGGETWSRAAR
jgi:uncharacterized protein (DUF2147 family)